MLMTFFLNDILDFTIFYEIVNLLRHFFQTCSFLFQQKLQYINYFFINRGCFTLEFYFNFIISHILIFKSIEDYTDYIFNYYTLTTLFNFKNFTDIFSFEFFLKILEPFSHIYLVISDEEMIPLSDRLLTPPRSPGMPETDSSFFSSSININSEDIYSESSEEEEEEDDENSSPSSWFEIYIKNPIKRFLSKFGIINNPVVEESNLLSLTTETLNSSLFPNQNGDLTSNSVLSSENLASSSTETTERRTSWVEYLFLRPFEYVMGKLGFGVKKTTDFVETDVVPTTNSSIPVDPLFETVIDNSEVVPSILEEIVTSRVDETVVSQILENLVVSSRVEETNVPQRVENVLSAGNSTTIWRDVREVEEIYQKIDLRSSSSNLVTINSNVSTSEVLNLKRSLVELDNKIKKNKQYLIEIRMGFLADDDNSPNNPVRYLSNEIQKLNDISFCIMNIKIRLDTFNFNDITKTPDLYDKIDNINFGINTIKWHDSAFPARMNILMDKMHKEFLPARN